MKVDSSAAPKSSTRGSPSHSERTTKRRVSRTGEIYCKFGCGKRCTPKGIWSHEAHHCPNNPNKTPRKFDREPCVFCGKILNSHYMRIHHATQHVGEKAKIGRPAKATEQNEHSPKKETARGHAKEPQLRPSKSPEKPASKHAHRHAHEREEKKTKHSGESRSGKREPKAEAKRRPPQGHHHSSQLGHHMSKEEAKRKRVFEMMGQLGLGDGQ